MNRVHLDHSEFVSQSTHFASIRSIFGRYCNSEEQNYARVCKSCLKYVDDITCFRISNQIIRG